MSEKRIFNLPLEDLGQNLNSSFNKDFYLEKIEMMCYKLCCELFVQPPGATNTISPSRLRSLSQSVYLMNTIHRLLCANRQVTQRELFYRSLACPIEGMRNESSTSLANVCSINNVSQNTPNPSCNVVSCFMDQAGLNRCLLHLTESLGCERHELGVFTTARGIVAADPKSQTLCLDIMGDFVADLSDHPDGMAVCEILTSIATIETTARYILVVEKDTVFQSLVTSDNFFEHVPCILVTARGYPDNITVRFLQLLNKLVNGSIPIVYLGDLDPHGISIFMTYCRAIGPHVKWIGLHYSDIAELDQGAITVSALGMKMKVNDTAIMAGLLQNQEVPDYVKVELGKIERKGLKYEVECLHSVGEFYLAHKWLPMKLASL